jgi:3,4-dihydroxy 2-butanone 4-phosphate synthase/GTP cyclohydrolase II
MTTVFNQFINDYKASKIAVITDDIAKGSTQITSAIIAPIEDISPDVVNQITKITGGLFMVSVSEARANKLQLQPMPKRNFSENKLDKTSTGLNEMFASVEARNNVTTGISASDRAQTLNVLGASVPNARAIVSPGHIFPILAKSGGILEKPAITEAALDCSTLAGFTDAALWVYLIDQNGVAYDPAKASTLAEKLNWPHINISDLLRHRLTIDATVREVANANLPTELGGDFKAYIFHSDIYQGEHIALVHGDISKEPVLTRVQSESTLSDVFGGQQSKSLLEQSLKKIKDNGSGVLIYLRRSAAGQIANQIAAQINPQTPSTANNMALMRNYGVGAQIIRALGIKKINLLSNSNKSIDGLGLFGVEIVSITDLS